MPLRWLHITISMNTDVIWFRHICFRKVKTRRKKKDKKLAVFHRIDHHRNGKNCATFPYYTTEKKCLKSFEYTSVELKRWFIKLIRFAYQKEPLDLSTSSSRNFRVYFQQKLSAALIDYTNHKLFVWIEKRGGERKIDAWHNTSQRMRLRILCESEKYQFIEETHVSLIFDTENSHNELLLLFRRFGHWLSICWVENIVNDVWQVLMDWNTYSINDKTSTVKNMLRL